MMDIDSAIQHCKEQVQEQAKRGCYSCAEEHQQLAEWLKELKEYREQRGGRMNVEEKERLIKKDIASIENRVRHAFNQGYEMGLKESSSEIPNTCGDAISRKAVLDIINFEDKWLLDAKEHNVDTKMAFWAIKSKISELASVIPQQRAEVLDKIRAEIMDFEEELFHRPNTDYSDYSAVRYCVEIIDKYKAESEEKE